MIVVLFPMRNQSIIFPSQFYTEQCARAATTISNVLTYFYFLCAADVQQHIDEIFSNAHLI